MYVCQISTASKRIMGVESLTCHTFQQVPSKILYMPLGKRLKGILLEKVKDAHPIQLSHQTRVIAVVEVLVEMNAFTAMSAIRGH